MIAKHLERVLAAAHVVCGPHKDLGAVNAAHEALAAALREADPHGLRKPVPLAQSAAFAQTGEPYEPKLRDCPRLPKLIGEHEAGTHD